MAGTTIPGSIVRAGLNQLRRSKRIILWTPEFKMGLGNHLYFWLWAHRLRRRGGDAWVLERPSMTPWIDFFPDVMELIVPGPRVGFLTRRTGELSPQYFGHDFDESDLRDFIRTKVLTSPAFRVESSSSDERVVINVRPGDYYSDFRIRGAYSFDVVEYLHAAMSAALQQGSVREVHIVSDDLQWCRARLAWLRSYSGGTVTFADPAAPPIQNFVDVATAQRLILTNSTFSYWAAYVSNVLHNNHRSVVAPWFHARSHEHGRAYQLNPRWTIIEDIPGGWDS